MLLLVYMNQRPLLYSLGCHHFYPFFFTLYVNKRKNY